MENTSKSYIWENRDIDGEVQPGTECYELQFNEDVTTTQESNEIQEFVYVYDFIKNVLVCRSTYKWKISVKLVFA